MQPFAFGCMIVTPAHLIEGQRLLNDVLSACQRTGRGDGFIAPLALLTLGGSADASSTYVFAKDVKRTPFNGWVLEGFDDYANRLGRPGFLANTKAVANLVAECDRRGFFDDLFNIKREKPAAAFLKMLRSLREVMAILAREPILVDTGQFRPRLQPRTYQDVENEVSNCLSNQPNYQARVKILTTECVLTTKPALATLTGNALSERLQAIKKHMRALGYTRPYLEVEREIRGRQERLLGISAEPPPATTTGRARPTRSDPDEPPPPGSFTLD